MSTCPVCSRALATLQVGGESVAGCRACGGLWLGRGQLQRLCADRGLLMAAGQSFAPEFSIADPATGPCPSCGQALTQFEFDKFPGIRLDRCKACGGLWLDHGEAEAIAGRLTPQPAADPIAPGVALASPPPSGADEGLELAFDPMIFHPPAEAEPPQSVPKPDAAPTPAPPAEDPGTYRAHMPEHFAQFEAGYRPKPYARAAVIAVALVGLVWWQWPTSINGVPVTPAACYPEGIDPCAGKHRCLVVITAPWCPTCRDARKTIWAIAQRYKSSPDIGVKLVVSFDELAKLEEDAQGFAGVPVFVDPKGTLMQALGEKTIPRFVVVNETGRVLKSTTQWERDVQPEIDFLGLEAR